MFYFLNNTHSYRQLLAFKRFLFILFCSIVSYTHIEAEGVADLQQTGDDPVMLLIGQPDFGDFAAFDGPESSRLYIRVANSNETVYIGLGEEYRFDGLPQGFGSYVYRIRRASDGEVVHGPFSVSGLNSNLSDLQQAQLGPEPLAPGGYPVPSNFVFQPTEAGDYFIEFSGINYMGLWDITVAENTEVKTGRVYAKNWTFRVPEPNPQLPDCVWGGELNADFYSYTSDGFVSRIDFEGSGFQPLSFTLSFNRTGPGESGDPLLDRMSMPNVNMTGSSADHLIFLSEPDVDQFPDGNCGAATLEDNLQCVGSGDGFCIPVSATAPGQVELMLDFNGNGIFDDDIDVILLTAFGPGQALNDCIFWDGLRGDGTAPDPNTILDIQVTYTQGVQHWALFDGEFMRNGFCVESVRPLCGDNGDGALYYDDRNITEDPGTSAPKDVRTGCPCATPNCRTWNNFDAMTDDCSDIDDELTTGYGDKSTLNTWWFASINSAANISIPLLLASIEGPDAQLCPGETTQLELIWSSPQEIDLIVWSGPSGPIGSGSDLFVITASEPGVYQAAVTDVAGCEFVAEFLLEYIQCDIEATVLSIECNDNGTDLDISDDVFFATVQINGTGAEGWRSDFENLSGSYGDTIQLGPYPISAGSIDILFQDNDNSCCQSAVTLVPPAPCSDGCAITGTFITDNRCDDSGTPLDPSDDVFLFELSLTAINGTTWTGDDGSSGQYDEVYTFGPYPINDGQVQIAFSDDQYPECAASITVTPPVSCSDSCLFISEVTEVYCDNSGTTANPFDDVFYFNLRTEVVNGTSLAYELEGLGLGLYGAEQTYGPFLISAGNLELDIWDAGDPECRQTLFIEAPNSCSDECGVVIADILPNCDDMGTPEVTDDIYYYEILVNSLSSANTSWVASDGSTGDYGEYVRSVDLSYSAEEILVSVADAGSNLCSDTASFTFPDLVFDCPNEVDSAPLPASFQTIRGTLEPGRFYFNQGEELSCWLDEDELQVGGRTYDRFTFINQDSLELTEPQLFTFYLFTDAPAAGAVGAVFQIDDDEPLDCCDLINPGPVDRWSEGELVSPFVDEADYPVDLELAQQFSMLIYPDREYTVVTTTWDVDITGTYEWLIVSMVGERLDIDNPFIEQTMDFEREVNFDLQTVHLPLAENSLESMDLFGRPQLMQGCGLVNLSFVDERDGSCDSMVLTRRFDAESIGGTEEGVCVQEIRLGYMGLDEVVLPPQAFQFSCTDTFPELDNGHPHPDFTGRPSIYYFEKTILLTEAGWRDFVATYEDSEVIRPDGGLNVYRSWTIADQCKDESMTYVQLFKLDAAGNPQFVCPTANHFCPIIEEDIMLFPTDTFECTADVEVALPVFEDICDSASIAITTLIYQLAENGDTIDIAIILPSDTNRVIEDLPLGDYFVDYTGTVPDQEEIVLTCRFRVADLSEPVAICKGRIDLPLTGFGVARLFTHQVDQHSYDNCGIETYEVRRQYFRALDSCAQTDTLWWSDWGPFVEFNCCDAGYRFEVEMRVIDSSGLINFCTAEVDVYDGIRPFCVGLEDLAITCNDLPDDFNPFDTTQLRLTFGLPEVIDNCEALALELEPIVAGDICAPEQIVRRFLAVDEFGNQALNIFTQTIDISTVLDYSIRFPQDTETDCVVFEDTVQLLNTACDSLTIAFEDEDLEPEGDECRHIARTFTVTNWCEWDGISEASVLSRDEDCDGTTGEEDLWVIRRPDTVYLDANGDETDNFPAAGTSDVFCTGETNPEGYWRIVESTGRWQYTQHIRFFDTLAPVVEIVLEDSLITEDEACELEAEFAIRFDEACPFGPASFEIACDLFNDGTVDGQYDPNDPTSGILIGSYPDFVFKRVFPIGRHRVFVVAIDDCGNVSNESLIFEVYDGYVPPLTCYDYRLYNLEQLIEPIDIDDDGELEEAAVVVMADELGDCLFDDCSEELIYSINRVGEIADPNRSFLYLDCDDRYSIDLEIYLWDGAFNPEAIQPDGTVGGRNWRSCVVTVWLQDPLLACDQCLEEQALTLAGTVRNWVDNTRMAGVTMSLDAQETSVVTPANGQYQFQMAAGASDVLKVHKNDDTQSGLNTLDMLILMRHILGVETIVNPYMLIAADINSDGEINVLDRFELQRIILEMQDTFTNNTSWRFVPVGWAGGPPPAEVQLNEMTACMYDVDFEGIKIGDLDGSYALNSGLLNQAASRAGVSLMATDAELLDGQVYELTISLNEAAHYAGGQAGLLWDPTRIDVQRIRSTALSNSDFNTSALSDGRLWFNWSSANSDDLVTLYVRAHIGVQLSEEVELLARGVWPAMVFDTGLAGSSLSLNWETVPGETALDANGPGLLLTNELLGNYPNPAINQTEIAVRMAEAQTGNLVIVDRLGRVLVDREIELVAGRNDIPVDLTGWAEAWYGYRILLNGESMSGHILKYSKL